MTQLSSEVGNKLRSKFLKSPSTCLTNKLRMRRFYLPHEQNKLRMRRFYPRLFIWMDRVEDDPLLTFVQKKRKIVKDQESGV